MISFLGGLLLVAAVVMLLLPLFITINEEPYTDERGRYVPASPKILTMWPRKNWVLTGIAGLALTLASGMFFINPSGTATSVQYLWGGDKAVTTQGVKMKLWGKTIPMSFEIAVQDVNLKRDSIGNTIGELPDKEGIYYREGLRREFADAIKADIAASLVLSVDYKNEDVFLRMADNNTSESQLVHARIYPVYDQALKNTCKLMDAQDYISGAAAQFDFYLKDQMENGMYLTEEVYEEEETSPITKGDTSRTVLKSKIKEKKQKKYRIRKDRNGDPIRDVSSSLKRYGITVQQAAITSIDWEDSFDKRLNLQKEQVAQTQLERASADKEYYAALSARAKGEREKTQVQVRLEKQQLEKTIQAETKAKVAKYKEEEEINLLAAERKRAQRVRIAADADAYEISKKVQAGIAPEIQLQMELDAKVSVMKALAGPSGVKLPSTVLGGSQGSSNAGMLESILGAKILTGDFK